MTEFDEIEKLFKKSIESIQEQKREVERMLNDVPEGPDRQEINNILKMAMDIKNPGNVIKAGKLAKQKAQEIKRRNGDKGNRNK